MADRDNVSSFEAGEARTVCSSPGEIRVPAVAGNVRVEFDFCAMMRAVEDRLLSFLCEPISTIKSGAPFSVDTSTITALTAAADDVDDVDAPQTHEKDATTRTSLPVAAFAFCRLLSVHCVVAALLCSVVLTDCRSLALSCRYEIMDATCARGVERGCCIKL